MCCLNSPDIFWELPWGAARLCHILRRAAWNKFREIWSRLMMPYCYTTFNRINWCCISYLNDAAGDCVCCVHIISNHCIVIGGRLWPSGVRGHPLGLTIALSSSGQSITIHYHNSGDHWPSLLSPGPPAWSPVPSSAPSSPIWWHISRHVRVSYHEKLLFCSHGVFLYRFDKQFMSFFMLWLVNGCILCNMKVFFQFVFTSQTMETTSCRQWLGLLAPRHQPRSLDVRPRHTLVGLQGLTMPGRGLARSALSALCMARGGPGSVSHTRAA